MQERPGAVRTIAFVWLGDLYSDDTLPNDIPTQVVTALGLAAFFASKQTVIVDEFPCYVILSFKRWPNAKKAI